eukprot:TRINITY_DN40149_c0_g1_i1.p1 TRINITY_DN40149_c0_g1~~TRINITY_DN40149_c0_g1_i1.p1  ORF type:complete len:1112 (+),score=225.05 TRINITY_DN40149_c0_g1_i1:116-3451(+)
MQMCCRRRQPAKSSVASINIESVVDKIVGDQPDAGVLQAVLEKVLTALVSVHEALESNPSKVEQLTVEVPESAPQEAFVVFGACGLVTDSKGRLKATSVASRQALQTARGVISQLLLSLKEESSMSLPADLAQPEQQQQVGPTAIAPPAGSVSRPVPTDNAAPSTLANEATEESRCQPQQPKSSAATAPDAAGTSASPAANAAGEQEAPESEGTSTASTQRGGSQAAQAGPAQVSPAKNGRVISFQRFDADKVLVDAATVREIGRICKQQGEQYVDPQFPATTSSLYMAPEEEHTWQCLSCQAHSKLPPVPPLAKSREEAKEQEQNFKDSVRCEGCGIPPHYIVQVRYFTRPTQWLRPGHRCEGCELMWNQPGMDDLAATMCTHYLRDSVSQTVLGTPWKVIREAARPEDVCQGALGNCWFAGALSVVAQLPELIDRLFLTKELNPHGFYHIQLCHAGKWVDLLIDDLFPTSQVSEGTTDGRMIRFSRGGNLCYLGGARRQLWPPLVEKAAAKLFGCYGSLKGGTFAEALALFTGYPTQRLRLYTSKAERAEKAQRRQARQQRRMSLLLAGADVPDELRDESDGDDDDLTWSKLLSCKDAGYLLGMGCSEEGCEKSKHHIVEEMGLQAPHAYGVLDLAEVVVDGRTVRLVKVRNPWGQVAPRTWKGKWGKDWEGWTPELQKQLGVVNSSGVLMDDPMSIFWMAFEDVKEYFPQVEICRVHMGWKEVREKAWLPSAVGPGQAFDLSVLHRTNVDIAFWQERHIVREGALGARCTNVDVGLAVLRSRARGADGLVQYELIEYAARCFDDGVSTEVILEGGYVYRIVPICFGLLHEPAPRKGVLAVHSVQTVELKCVESSWREVAVAATNGIQKRGKRWSHHRYHGLTYWHQFEPGGCTFMVENATSQPVAVQADASDSVGCISSRGDLGVVAQVPAQSRRIILALAFSPGSTRASASIQPQLVPLEMAPSDMTVDADTVHMALPLVPKGWQDGSVPPPPASQAHRTPAESRTVAGSQSSSGGQSTLDRQSQATEQHSAADDDLAEAIRLSLAQPTATSAQDNTAVGKEAKALLEKRTKELFTEYRHQGMAPNDAAARAADEARRVLGIAAMTA